jgi:hypothetical protein
MGYSVLNDPDVVVGHRFRSEGSGAEARHAEIWANLLRMARKNFGDATWDEWLSRFRGRIGQDLFDQAWACFDERRESVEGERDYLLSHRPWDEFDFAEHFRLKWPRWA